MKNEKIQGENEFVLETEVMSAVTDHPMLVFALKKKYLTERLWDLALQKDPSIFKYQENPDYNDCLKAVLLDGRNLAHVPRNFLTYDLCAAGIRNIPNAILDIPPDKLDSRLIQEAIDMDGSLLKFFVDEVDGFYLEDKIASHPNLILGLPNPDNDLIITAIENNPGLMYTIPAEWWKKGIREELLDRHPDWDSYIPNI